MSLTVKQGSILGFEGDAIVNAANGFLMHGAGLAKVIADAARGPRKDCIEYAYSGTGPVSDYTALGKAWDAEQRAHPTIATGNVGVTSAGSLPYKGIIHAVGPVWNGGAFFERQLLASAYDEAVAAAVKHGWHRVAFPALSVGLFHFPAEEATRIAVASLTAAPLDVTVYLYHPSDDVLAHLVRCYEDAILTQEVYR